MSDCNNSFFQTTNTTLVLDDRFNKVEFAITDYIIPGFNIGIIEEGYHGTTIITQGDSIVFNDLNFSILLDKNFTSYENVYNYLLERVDGKEGVFRPKKAMFQATIIINSNKNNPIAKFVYNDVIIESIGDIQLTKSESQKAKFEVVAKYNYFEFIKI